MTDRERFLAILARKAPDRVPWLPRLKLWYDANIRAGTMPKRFEGMSLRQLEKAVGCGTPARDGKIFETRHENLDVVVTKKGDDTFTEYRTPVGTLTEQVYISPELAAAGLPGRHVKHLLQKPEDYKIWEYVAEHTFYKPAYEAYLEYDKEVGDDGFPMISAGDVPFHFFLLRLAGYGDAYLQIADHTPEFEHLMKVMYQVDKERLWPVILNSPAKVINHGSHFDSRMTPPPYFKKYITPYYKEFAPLIHAKGMYLSYHADNDNHLLLDLAVDAGYDMGECFATWPMNQLTTAEAYKRWYPTKTIIWGGIPSVAFSVAMSDAEFEQFMDDLFKGIAPGDNIILGIADNLMPGHFIERVERVSQLVAERGVYPIKA
jgi:hypothetical protein